MKRKNVVYAALVVGILIPASFIAYQVLIKSDLDGLTKIENYKPVPEYVTEERLLCGASLQNAYNPGCGYCPGIVKDDECFVDFSKLTEQQKVYEHLLKVN